MDFYDATKLLFDRIEKLEPENVGKIVGFLLLQDLSEKDMIRLAHSPNRVIEERVQEAKLQFSGMPTRVSGSSSISGFTSSIQASEQHLVLSRYPLIMGSRNYSLPIPITPNPYWNHQLRAADQQQQVVNPEYACLGYQDEDYKRISNQPPPGHLLSVDHQDQVDGIGRVGGGGGGYPHGEFYYSDPTTAAAAGMNGRMSRRSPSLPNFSVKTCHYFNKGFCKHGSNCRYFHGGGGHGHSLPESFSHMVVPNPVVDAGNGDDHAFSPLSLDKLEAEITELLNSRRGNPVSIASLPMMYQEKYGRSLQAEGYLTESQRHGKAGYSLTKLLARLKSIRLFDRPHGQHFVVLAEDAAKYTLESHSDRKDPGPVVAGSRQIYLTFPAESTFTEEDVSNYFSAFGSVEDVRIPCQQKRMFGFVTFSCPNTVKMVLAKGNPHFVCGARVLVKPYREKSKLVERKYMEKTEHQMYYQGNFWDFETEIHPMSRGYEAPRFLRRQLMEEQERALELETRRLSELKIIRKPVSEPTYYAVEELNIASEEHSNLPSSDCFNHFLDDRSRLSGVNYSDHDSNQAINLPDSPFGPQIPSSIPTAI